MKKTIDRDEVKIRALNIISAQLANLYQDAGDKEGSDDLIEIIATAVADIQRRSVKREGTLDDLARLKAAVRLSGVVMECIQNDEPAAMSGWRYRQTPKNIVQRVYSFVTNLSIELMKSAVAIEEQFPHLQSWFDQEREEYRRECELIEAEAQD